MRKDNKKSKVKIPLIITGIGFATHLMPFVILFPVLLLSTILKNELEVEVLGNIFILLFLFSLLIYVISVFLAPIIQFVLAVVAVINKSGGWLVCILYLQLFFVVELYYLLKYLKQWHMLHRTKNFFDEL